jgi:hypothetical protein
VPADDIDGLVLDGGSGERAELQPEHGLGSLLRSSQLVLTATGKALARVPVSAHRLDWRFEVIAEPELRRGRRAASALLIPVVLAVILAVFWPGPVAVAAVAETGSHASSSPAPVKYYIVPPAGQGSADSLYVIAARTLGNGSRYKEIFDLNKGRLQPNGGRLEDPGEIEPGWILKLPADATGPGVHFGALPGPAKKVAKPVTHQPTRPGAAPSAAPGWIGPAGVIVVSMAVAGLTFGLLRRRRRGGKSDRKHAATRTRSAQTRPGPESVAPTPLGTPAADFQGPDMGWLDAVNESAWQDWGAAPALHPDHPSAPQPRIDRRAGRWDGPAGSILTGPHDGGGYVATAHGTRGQPGLQLLGHEATALRGPVARDAGDLRAADSLWLAHRVLAEADQRAAEVTLHAQGQATSIRAAADREAAEMRQQASDQAAALLAAAELDAAHMRTAVMTMSAELSQIAAYVTENLTGIPARPAAKPAAQPAAKPAAQPAAKPAREPAAKPAVQPTARPRQYSAMRRVVAVVAALVLLAVVSCATELGLHGFRFFVFRSAGTGATPGGGLKEDQGPGQPDAPSPRVHVLIPHHAQHSPKPTRAAGGTNG